MAKRHSQGTRSLLEEMGDLGGFAESSDEIAGKGVRVVSLVLDRIQPDPGQPRRVLPAALRDDFIERRISARQALERWEAIVAEEATSLGRPRPDWLALMESKPEDTSYESNNEIDPPGQPGPEEDMLRSIVATAATIRHGGQISPITVSEYQGYYRIETGERRFWAHHWLNMWLSNDYDQIQCIIVPDPSPWRQAAENTTRESLSAMAMARQVSRLLMYMHGLVPNTSHPVPNDWYRQAFQLRVMRGEGEHLRASLGGMQRAQFSRYLALLRLPDEAWELADRYRLEEKRLRYVLKVPDKTLQVELVRAIVEQDLSADRVQQLVESDQVAAFLHGGDSRPKSGSPGDVSEKVAMRWPGLAKQLSRSDLSLVADEWVRRENPDDLREQVATLRELLDLVEGRVRYD